jgi:hypothetical protein
MYGLLFRITDHGIIAPLDLSFCILHTRYDYWMISGEQSFVEALVGGDFEAGMQRFEDEAEDGLVWAPGPQFPEAVVERYRRYNEKAGKKLRFSQQKPSFVSDGSTPQTNPVDYRQRAALRRLAPRLPALTSRKSGQHEGSASQYALPKRSKRGVHA